MADDGFEPLEPTLRNVVEQKTLRWVFVGGKGGVGKTTTSCSLAVLLAATRGRVLLISTDPAHNVSDAFDQKFTKVPTLVNGFNNLFAMEVDANLQYDNLPDEYLGENATEVKSMMSEFLASFPGVDEAMSYLEVMKLVRKLDFDVVVFDTAPTGHTLRLLAFPSLVEQGIEKVIKMKNLISTVTGSLSAVLGFPAAITDQLTNNLEDMLPFCRAINEQFRNPDCTTFVCVCIAEFLSVYETERLVQELTRFGIDTHNVVVNMLLFPEDDSSKPPTAQRVDASGCTKSKDGNEGNEATHRCRMCAARYKLQQKYMTQVEELYTDFHVTKLPLLESEVRGIDQIRRFGRFLLEPCRPEVAYDFFSTSSSLASTSNSNSNANQRAGAAGADAVELD